ncbi:GbsR/MarR family transcriptional regulator [Geobacter sp. AOG1]|uniref:GbsR/MarR family transcriptional regulator n=1 Tax=Geobacter sp. AOG1 TaxID=1566346 RepID=UPI001CC6F4EE|nr:MarR family transcriptional regulator [Geobacter sp. AOG1]GFE57114.1 transcriptional regulator [Geobacter sp. AOG1]
MNEELINQFVETWGTMGSAWGVNNSVARVHGLLIITDRPWCIDEIVERLQISKSNVSTSLKELRSWNVIRKVFLPGDRREFYACEPDAWEMLFNIMRQRKQRELDPILASISLTCEQAKKAPSGIAVDRLAQMKQMLDVFDNLARLALKSEAQVKALVSLLPNRK